MSITKILEAKDARIEHLLGLLDQAEEFAKLVIKRRDSGITRFSIIRLEAELLKAKIQKEREV